MRKSGDLNYQLSLFLDTTWKNLTLLKLKNLNGHLTKLPRVLNSYGTE